MTVKLNLTLDKDVVAKSKHLAAKSRTSVSKLVQDLLRKHLHQMEKKNTRKSFTEEYAGVLKEPIGDIRKVKEEYINKKYGL